MAESLPGKIYEGIVIEVLEGINGGPSRVVGDEMVARRPGKEFYGYWIWRNTMLSKLQGGESQSSDAMSPERKLIPCDLVERLIILDPEDPFLKVNISRFLAGIQSNLPDSNIIKAIDLLDNYFFDKFGVKSREIGVEERKEIYNESPPSSQIDLDGATGILAVKFHRDDEEEELMIFKNHVPVSGTAPTRH